MRVYYHPAGEIGRMPRQDQFPDFAQSPDVRLSSCRTGAACAVWWRPLGYKEVRHEGQVDCQNGTSL